MKKATIMLIVLIAFAASAAGAACVTIKAGILNYSAASYLAGQPLKVGFDSYGYNYQAHLFNGSYFNAYANGDGFPPYDGDDTAYLAMNPTAAVHWAWPYRSITVNMKWNDAWLSNQDCDSDGKLDRHFGFPSYIGSGAWLTNHLSDTYELAGQTIHWTDFIKIVAVPLSADPCSESLCSTLDTTLGLYLYGEGRYYTDSTHNTEIGPVIWGAFAVIQEVWNDPGMGLHGVLIKSPVNPGFGYWGKQP